MGCLLRLLGQRTADWEALTMDISLSQFWRLEVKDQDAGRFDARLWLSAWFADGLLAET